MHLNQVTVPAFDIQRSCAFYELLGLRKIVENDHYVRFRCPVGESTFSIELANSVGNCSSIVIYFETDNLDQEIMRLKALGVEFTQDAKDEPWLWREAYLNDPAGNTLCLYYAGKNRIDPPWKLAQVK